jgi:hypothetical protein
MGGDQTSSNPARYPARDSNSEHFPSESAAGITTLQSPRRVLPSPGSPGPVRKADPWWRVGVNEQAGVPHLQFQVPGSQEMRSSPPRTGSRNALAAANTSESVLHGRSSSAAITA